MSEQINEAFLINVAGILEQARQNAKAAIDLSNLIKMALVCIVNAHQLEIVGPA